MEFDDNRFDDSVNWKDAFIEENNNLNLSDMTNVTKYYISPDLMVIHLRIPGIKIF